MNILEWFFKKNKMKDGINCPIQIRNGKVYPILKQYSTRPYEYYSKPHEVQAVLYKIFKESRKKKNK